MVSLCIAIAAKLLMYLEMVMYLIMSHLVIAVMIPSVLIVMTDKGLLCVYVVHNFSVNKTHNRWLDITSILCAE